MRSIDIDDLTPLTVFVGPNGSGKSTLLDVFGFLSDCFRSGLRLAWDVRGQGQDIRARGRSGPVEIEVGYREGPDRPRMIYHLSIAGDNGELRVAREWLGRQQSAQPDEVAKILDFTAGRGTLADRTGAPPKVARTTMTLSSPELLAVNAVGQFETYKEVTTLRAFILDWYVAELSTPALRGLWQSRQQERLSRSGDNIADVVGALAKHAPERLNEVIDALRRLVPLFDGVGTERLRDGRLLLTIKDRPFDDPITSHHTSEGTLKLLAYLILLRDPAPPRLIGIEEPETLLHPRLLYGLGEEFRAASERAQIFVTTHSPSFLDAVRADEVRFLTRDPAGFTRVARTSDVRGIREFVREGAQLGELWMEGRFGAGDPLNDSIASGATGRS